MAGTGIHPYHQQWPPAAAPPPPPPAAIPSPSSEEVRTIFITGLPEDVRERELQNLLRWLPGFEASQLNFKAEKPMGFALFSSPHQAIAAKDILQDMLFDPESKSVLHTEMAKKNLFVKRGIGADAGAFDQSKRYMAPPPPPPYDPYAGYSVAPVPMPAPVSIAAPSSYVPIQNTKDNPPCNTLFIGNLGENINEDEVRGLFSVQPGFKQMKIIRQERHTVCFIEFEDVNSATNVHHNLQGAVIPSS
ncbi:hypothetical protein TSUD_298070, partial [Trifolium subterraneum]